MLQSSGIVLHAKSQGNGNSPHWRLIAPVHRSRTPTRSAVRRRMNLTSFSLSNRALCGPCDRFTVKWIISLSFSVAGLSPLLQVNEGRLGVLVGPGIPWTLSTRLTKFRQVFLLS